MPVGTMCQPVTRTPARLAHNAQKRHPSPNVGVTVGHQYRSLSSISQNPIDVSLIHEGTYVQCGAQIPCSCRIGRPRACVWIRAELALAARARRAALGRVGSGHMEAHCASETALSLGARPCSDVPAAPSNKQPAFACARTQTRLRLLSLGRRRSTCACGVRVPRRAN